MGDADSTDTKPTHLRSVRKNRTAYKVAISILFGLLGFVLNFYPLDFVFYGSYKMSFLFGLVFPMVITLAWGWKWGLLSALCGGCQTMWFLWFPQSHYAALVSVPPFTLWIVWLGWFSRTKRNVYLGEALFRIFNTALLYTLFRWAFALNVPPANVTMPLPVAHSFVFKEALNGVLILFIAQALLQSNTIRRFLKLPRSTADPQTYYVYTNAVILGAMLLVGSVAERYIWGLWGSEFQDMARILGSLALLMVGIACTYSTANVFARRRTDAFIQTREALRISEEKPSQIVAGTSVPLFVIDTEHTVTHWNKACEVLTGVPAEDRIGTTRHWSPFYATKRPVLADLIVDQRPEEDVVDYYGESYKQSTLIEGAYEADGFFPHLGERGKWLFFTAAPLRDHRGKIIGAIETLQDITERKRAEKRIHHLNSVLSVIRNVNQLIVAEKDRASLLQKACDALVEARGYDASWLAFSKDAESLTIVTGSGPGEETSRIAEYLIRGDFPRCVRTMLAQEEKLLVFDKRRECGECPFRNTYASPITVIIRIEHGGSHFGLLIISLGADIVADEEEKGLLIEVADDIAIALRNIELEEAQERVNQALRESEERFRQMAEVIPAAFWMYTADNRTALYASPAFEKIFGHPCETLRQRPRLWFEILHPEDRERVAAIEEAHIGKEVEKEYRIIQPDGSIHWIHSHRIPVRDEQGEISNIVGFTEDITERKRAGEALQRSEEKYRLLAETARDIILTHDMTGRITYANEATVELSGYSMEELLDMNVRDFVSGDQHTRVKERAASRADGNMRIYTYEIEFITRTGQRIPMEVGSSVFVTQGKPSGVLLIGRDITERKQAQARIRQTLTDLERSNRDLEQFAYVASHDLQEPLRMVSSYVQLLAQRYKGKLDADADDFISYAVDGARRMQRLINDLLAYSRVGTRGQPFEPTDCEFILHQVLDNLQVAVEESSATVTHAALPIIMADSSQMTQLFQNLIDNAIKFRSEAPPRVHVSAEENGNEWIFSVHDNGLGIASEYFERIVVIFQRLHTREEYPGTGIGLAVCKRIVERHGGRLWVKSEPGQGSTFLFTIPKGERQDP